jgi:phosphoribosylamine--glycine ligase
MQRHNIPTAKHAAFTDFDSAVAYVKSQNSYPAVIKCDGLALGKGVIIPQNEAEAIAALTDMMKNEKFGAAGKSVVIEEYLNGVEVTVLTFTDGKTIVPMPPCTDHKRVFDNDEGANTGGMGVVGGKSALPYYTPAIADECMERIFIPTVNGIRAEGRPFKGCLYFGLMLTSAGVKVIEYNCRFGDPEAQTVLPLLETPLLDVMEAICEERLDTLNVTFSAQSSACVVMASGGYPEKYETGYVISGLDKIAVPNVHIYHAGTALAPDGTTVTAGGRVLAVTAVEDKLQEALDTAYAAVGQIKFEGAHYRRDIGQRAIESGSL